jgi:glucokinase
LNGSNGHVVLIRREAARFQDFWDYTSIQNKSKRNLNHASVQIEKLTRYKKKIFDRLFGAHYHGELYERRGHQALTSGGGMNETMQNISNAAVFDFLLARRRTNIKEVTSHLGIPGSTAVGIMSRLLEEGVVRRGPSRGGRRGRPIATFVVRIPQPVVVCQFNGTQLAGAVVDSDLSILARDTRRVTRIESVEQALDQTRDLVENLLDSAGMARTKMPGVGLSINAVPLGKRALSSSVLPWVDERIEEQFSAALGLPVQLVSGSGVVAEYHAMSKPLPRSLVNFIVADGISAHGMIDGRVHYGSHGLGGEIGHVIQSIGGPLCGCGQRGCLEAYCSGPAICARIQDDLRQPVTSSVRREALAETSPRVAIEVIHDAWIQGDTYVRAAMDDVFERLGWGLGVVTNLVDPDHIAMGGYVLERKPLWIEQIIQRAQRWILHAARRLPIFAPAKATLDDELCVLACGFFYSRLGGGRGTRRSKKRDGGDEAGRAVERSSVKHLSTKS